MKKILFVLFFGLYAANVSAQDRLRPVESVYNADPQDMKYPKVHNKAKLSFDHFNPS